MACNRSAWSLASALGLAAAATAAPAVAQLTCEQQTPPTCERIEDTEFIETQWSKGYLAGAPFPNPGNAVDGVVREITGGNSGSWRHMIHEFRGQEASLHVYHLYEHETYEPATQGAISGIDYSHDHTTFVNEVRTDIVLQQGSKRFRFDLDEISSPVDGGWVSLEAPHCLGASQFVGEEGGGHPDFSAQGAEITFGYSRRNNIGGAETTVWESGIDNFRVVIYKTPNAGCNGGPPLLRIAKTDHGHSWGDDPLIPYEITVKNVGGAAAPSRSLTEIVPVNTTWSAGASSAGWTCTPGSGENSSCIYQLPSLPPGASHTVVFSVRVDDGTPSAFEVYNQASVNPSAPELTRVNEFIAWCFCYFFGLCLDYDDFRYVPPDVDTRARTVARAGSSNGSSETVIDYLLHYQLRDQVLRRTPGGRRFTEFFYDTAEDMVPTIASVPNGFDLSGSFMLAWQPHWRALVEGHGSELTIGTEQTQSLLDFWVTMEQATTSSALADSVALELARLDVQSWIGLDMNEWLAAMNVMSCQPNDRVLCLNGGRFRVEAEWLTDKGDQGHGHAVSLTDDTGYFWFFDDDNVELVLKVLDACPSGFHNYWVFAGGLTDVNTVVTVTDTETGLVRRYENPQKTRYQPIQDTSAFATCDAPPRAGAGLIAERARVEATRPPALEQPSLLSRIAERVAAGARWLLSFGDASAAVSRAGSCSANATTLCLDDGRFAVSATWKTAGGASGSGQVVPLTADTGYFWFFDQQNVEMVVKTLDACASPFESFWVFAAGLTDVEVELAVLDTVAQQTRTYRNPQKTRFLPIQDTTAFRTCGAQ